MADYGNSKSIGKELYLPNAIETAWQRLEPLVTPEQLRMRKLWGIPLYSAWRQARSNEPAPRITDEQLKDVIRRAVMMLETEARLTLMPTKFRERKAFDRQEFDSYGFFRLENRPVTSVDKLSIQDSNAVDVWTVPPQWIEPGYLARGQVYILPLSPANTGATFAALGTGSPYGLAMMHHMTMTGRIPAYWTIEYTAGFPDGQLPGLVNELVAVIAAMEVLGVLAPTFALIGSHSLGIDGLSQSISIAGAGLFQQRMQELGEQKKTLMGQLRNLFGKKMVVGAL